MGRASTEIILQRQPVQEYEFGTAQNKIDYVVPADKVLYVQQLHVSFSEGDKYLIEIEADGVPFGSIGGGEGKTGGNPMLFPPTNPAGPFAAGVTIRLNRQEGDGGKDWGGGFFGFLRDT